SDFGRFQAVANKPPRRRCVDQIAPAFAKTGKAQEAENFSRRARAIDKNNVSYVYDQARIQAALGQTCQALRTLQEALDQQFPCEYAQGDPDLEVLRTTPEISSYDEEMFRGEALDQNCLPLLETKGK